MPGSRRTLVVGTAAVVAATAWLGSAAVVAPAAAQTAAPATRTSVPLPERLANVGNSRQVVVVTASGWDTSRGRLQAWQQRRDGSWHQMLAPVPARLGWNGFIPADQRLQGSGETPAGTFRLLRGFGLVQPSGVSLPYRVVDASDWWPYDPRDATTYNVFQTRRAAASQWRTSWAEHLDSFRHQYRFAVVLDYNLPSGVHRLDGQRVASVPADTTKGGGIFLHVSVDGPTAGCIAVARDHMRKLLRWLDPVELPIIVAGPRAVIDQM